MIIISNTSPINYLILIGQNDETDQLIYSHRQSSKDIFLGIGKFVTKIVR